MSNVDQLSRVYGPATWRVYDLLDRSLEPRGPEFLHDLANDHVAPGAVILDAGCRDAAHLIRLVRAHDVSGVGVDPVEIHVERAREAVAAAALESRIQIVHGLIETLPHPERHFDFVWCRDVVEQVADLPGALATLAHVLKSGGRMLVYTTFITDSLSDEEAAMLDRSMGNVHWNLIESNVESAFSDAGLAITVKDVIGTEFKEDTEERTNAASRTLLRIARLRRLRAMVVEEHGKDVYEHIEANLHWELFQFLGKLQPTVYVLERTELTASDLR